MRENYANKLALEAEQAEAPQANYKKALLDKHMTLAQHSYKAGYRLMRTEQGSSVRLCVLELFASRDLYVVT